VEVESKDIQNAAGYGQEEAAEAIPAACENLRSHQLDYSILVNTTTEAGELDHVAKEQALSAACDLKLGAVQNAQAFVDVVTHHAETIVTVISNSGG